MALKMLCGKLIGANCRLKFYSNSIRLADSRWAAGREADSQQDTHEKKSSRNRRAGGR